MYKTLYFKYSVDTCLEAGLQRFVEFYCDVNV